MAEDSDMPADHDDVEDADEPEEVDGDGDTAAMSEILPVLFPGL
jgi:hypothetical protein